MNHVGNLKNISMEPFNFQKYYIGVYKQKKGTIAL